MKIRNKKIWITGASAGIGKALSMALANKGAQIILSSRNKKMLNELQVTLPGEKHVVEPIDLLDTSNLENRAQAIIDRHPDIDILINNAGVSQRDSAINTSVNASRKIMELNFFAPVILTKLILPQFIEKRGGMFVNISSVAGKVGVKRRSSYCASKHALIGYMDSVRAEHADHDIEVLNICPGFVRTDIAKNAITGNGESLGHSENTIEGGLSPQYCAEQIVKAIEKSKKEVIISGSKEYAASLLRRFWPNRLFDMMAKHQED